MKPLIIFMFMFGVILIEASDQVLNPKDELIASNIPANSSDNKKTNTSASDITSPTTIYENSTVTSTVTPPMKPSTITPSTEPSSTEPSSTEPSSTDSSSLYPVTDSLLQLTTTMAPVYGVGRWNVTEKNETCIIITGELKIELVNLTDNKVIKTIPVPSNSKTNGSCVKQEIGFFLPNSSFLSMSFGADKQNYYIGRISGEIHTPLNINNTVIEKFENSTLEVFKTSLNNSYLCERDSEVVISKPTNNTQFVLKVSEFQMQAFKRSKSKDFDSAINCEISNNTPDIVPIIVACALAVLVIAVLIAYLISRRRSQSQGYMSM